MDLDFLTSLQNSLSELVAVMRGFYNLITGLPGFCQAVYNWCVETFLWCLFAPLFAYLQRFFMILTGTWRPR